MSLRVLHFQNETKTSCPDLKGENYRASFHAHSSAKGPRKKIYHGHLDGKGPRKGEKAVVKMFRSAAGTEAQCDSEIDKHKRARRMARKFNLDVPDDRNRLQFTLPLKSSVGHLGVGFYLTRHKSRHMDKQEWVLIEENLERQGEYQVFIRRTGHRLIEDPTTLDAFLHFTYHQSGGHFVMCGFQGIQTRDGYLLTTPCIHSTDFSFGEATDKGPRAIRQVFKHHRCNNLCYSFIKPDLHPGPGEHPEDDSEGEEEEHSFELLENGVATSSLPEEKEEDGHLSERSKQALDLHDSVALKKKKAQGSLHRCNVKAVGELERQASF